MLEFIDVDFAVPDKKILSGLSFEIKPGQKVGFCGAAGSGKSTSFNLMKRFYNPTSGTILLDGRPIADYDVNALRWHRDHRNATDAKSSSSLRRRRGPLVTAAQRQAAPCPVEV